MSARRPATGKKTPPPKLPCDAATWKRVAERLALSPQQKRIVELILCGKQDRDIAETLGLTVPTVRTYLTRVFARVGVTDRMDLVLQVFALAVEEAAVRK
ncbi:MAG: helix-turn-helix transcriptional regulator [Pirellulales bacterium]|nr:helix-turn-helix transcriptional regulator [Pirellulales bacterium]